MVLVATLVCAALLAVVVSVPAEDPAPSAVQWRFTLSVTCQTPDRTLEELKASELRFRSKCGAVVQKLSQAGYMVSGGSWSPESESSHRQRRETRREDLLKATNPKARALADKLPRVSNTSWSAMFSVELPPEKAAQAMADLFLLIHDDELQNAYASVTLSKLPK